MEMNYDEKTLQELETQLRVEIIPGTEIMTDIGSHHFIKAPTSSNRVLVPQPSNDPNDPLNWSPLWKTMAITSTLMSTFSMGFGPLAVSPMFGYFIKEFDHSLADVVQFVGVCLLVLGFSNLFWIPLSSMFGRRLVLITSTLVCLACNIWRAEAKTYNSFLAACAVNGFGAGPSETLGPVVIADIFFLHDRGTYNALYFATYFGSLVIGATVAGPMADHVGWRNFYWLNVGILGLSVTMLIFMFPETKWHRVHPAELVPGTPVSSSAVGPETHLGIEDEKNAALSDLIKPSPTPSETVEPESLTSQGGPSKQQFKFCQAKDPRTTLLSEILTPWKLLTFPIVEFASFVVSWSASLFLTVNLTQAQNFAAPPYNYSSEVIGAFNVAVLIGAFIGLGTAGPLSDWISMRLTRKNNGIREPEMRLITMIPYVLIMILSNVILAVGYQQSWSWKVIVILGYTGAGIQVAAIPAIASTYAVDSYKPVAGTIFVSITINKNLWGYGFSKFITPWITKSGYVPPIMTNMTLTTVWCLFGILFWYKGKTFRRWSKGSKVHQM